MKALVICGDSIGDVVFATPVIRALKVQLEAAVHGLVSSSNSFLLDENPYIDGIFFRERSLLSAWQSLRKRRFDVIVNLATDRRSRILAFLLRAPVYSLPTHRWKKWLMVILKVDHLQNIHMVDRMMQLLLPLAIKTDELGLDFFIPEKDKVEMAWLPAAFQKGYVAFPINAPYATRKLPVDRIIALCDKINRPIILLGNQDDYETGEIINRFFERGAISTEWEAGLRELSKKTVIYNACGKFNFNQMASVVKQAHAVFAFDGDFIPVASAFRKEIFGMWGNTIPLFGRYPYRTKFSTLESPRVSCRPCTINGFNKCPRGHFKCMNEIVLDFYLT